MKTVIYNEKNHMEYDGDIVNGKATNIYLLDKNKNKKYYDKKYINNNTRYLICSCPKTGSTTIWQNIIRYHGYSWYKHNNNYELSGIHTHRFHVLKRKLTHENQFIIVLVRNFINQKISKFFNLFFCHRSKRASEKDKELFIKETDLNKYQISDIIKRFFKFEKNTRIIIIIILNIGIVN